mgnify:CR=1 FL=1
MQRLLLDLSGLVACLSFGSAFYLWMAAIPLT